VQAQCRRLGYSLQPDKVIDLVDLERALADKDIGARIALRTALYRLNPIPA
jgi:hypothetical protein